MVLGLSIHTTAVEMREKLAVPEVKWIRAIDKLSNQNHIKEAGVLSTCNRFEIYMVAVLWNRGVKEVTEWMSKTSRFFQHSRHLNVEDYWRGSCIRVFQVAGALNRN